MAVILSTPTEIMVQDTSPSRPLLSAITRLWAAPAVAAPMADADVGYESALPWMLSEPADSAY